MQMYSNDAGKVKNIVHVSGEKKKKQLKHIQSSPEFEIKDA